MNWEFEHKIKTELSKKTTIWKKYKDVKNWNSWDKEIEFSNLKGDFKEGSRGSLKSIGGPKVNFELIEVEEEKKFVDITNLFLCKLIFTHTLEEKSGALEVTHKIRMEGFLTFFFKKVIGEELKKTLPKTMKNLVS